VSNKKVRSAPALRLTGVVEVWETTRLTYISRAAAVQGLTLVHFSAHFERFVWDRGCA